VRLSLVLACSLASLLACKGEQVLKDDCPESGKACPACATDAECFIVANACSEIAYCTHRERVPPLAADNATCSGEYDKPAPERCGCVEKICRVR
jgi:hypothetical protein